jgi:hypothetical protein
MLRRDCRRFLIGFLHVYRDAILFAAIVNSAIVELKLAFAHPNGTHEIKGEDERLPSLHVFAQL